MEHQSNCCFAAITMQDQNGHGKCAECGENCTPDTKYIIEDLRNPYTFNPVALALILLFFLLLSSCASWENLPEGDCQGYRMPLASPFFEVSYSLGKREIYVSTDIPLARNKQHFIRHHDTCSAVQVSSIKREGDFYHLTFILSESQFDCFKINLNESHITYCTRSAGIR